MHGRLICRVFGFWLMLLPSTFFGSPDARWQDSFGVDETNLLSTGSNAWFVLKPGYQCVFEGREDGEKVRLTITVLEETKKVGGVETRLVEEREVSAAPIATTTIWSPARNSPPSQHPGEDAFARHDAVAGLAR